MKAKPAAREKVWRFCYLPLRKMREGRTQNGHRRYLRSTTSCVCRTFTSEFAGMTPFTLESG